MNLSTTVGAGAILANIALLVSVSNLNHKLDQVHDNVDKLAADVEEIQDSLLTKTSTRIKLTKAEKLCLARNVFFEAGVESHEGKIAVAQVTYNRLKTKRWGDTVCDVIHAKSQFSWTLYPKLKNSTPNGELWDLSVKAVDDFKNGYRINKLEKSLNYHATYVNPYWVDKRKKIVQIGTHVFYMGTKQASKKT